MPSGVRVWSSSGALRLDPGDKQVMHYAFYSGTLTGGGSSTTTVTIGGGYDITSGDWGIDITPVDYYLEAVSTSNTVTFFFVFFPLFDASIILVFQFSFRFLIACRS